MAESQANVRDALLAAHRALLKDLQGFQAAAHALSAEPLTDLLSSIGRTREHLAEHFRLEEQNGYMAGVLLREPHLQRAVDRLAAEHGELLGSLDELRAEAEAAQATLAALRLKAARWVQRVRRHERSENALLQDAFTVDLNAED
jgi:hypothetical protein